MRITGSVVKLVVLLLRVHSGKYLDIWAEVRCVEWSSDVHGTIGFRPQDVCCTGRAQ